MRSLALIVGVFVTLVGATGIVAPDLLLTFRTFTVRPLGLYTVAAVRVGIGLALLGAATASRAPTTLRVFGVFAVVAGVATAITGPDRARAIMEWLSGQGPTFLPTFIRLGAGFALVLGGFITYVVGTAPRRTR